MTQLTAERGVGIFLRDKPSNWLFNAKCSILKAYMQATLNRFDSASFILYVD